MINIPDIMLTANFKRALAAFESLQFGSGRFVQICGATGSGKSTLARLLKDRFGAPIVTLYTTMSVRDILSSLKHQAHGWAEDGYPYRGPLYELFMDVVGALRDRRIPFFAIDEADRFNAGRRFAELNVVRDVVDASGTNAGLLGTDVMRTRLAVPGPYLAQISSRIIETVEFGRPGLGDVRKIAESLGVRLADEVLKFLLAQARGSLRPFVDRLRAIDAVAREAGLQDKTLDFAACRRLGVIAIAASSDAVEANEDSRLAMDVMTNREHLRTGIA